MKTITVSDTLEIHLMRPKLNFYERTRLNALRMRVNELLREIDTCEHAIAGAVSAHDADLNRAAPSHGADQINFNKKRRAKLMEQLETAQYNLEVEMQRACIEQAREAEQEQAAATEAEFEQHERQQKDARYATWRAERGG